MSRVFIGMRRRSVPVSLRVLAVFVATILVSTGCSERSEEKPEVSVAPAKVSAARSASPTNRVSLAELFPGATTKELSHIKACQDAIDDDRNSLAMRHARELMDSTNATVRLHAVETFGWIGKIAINELAEMMADPDTEVAEEALRQWEMAFDEFSGEAVKTQKILMAVQSLKDQQSTESVMMKLADLEDYNAIRLLSDVITSTNANPVVVEVARSEYASLAGEAFVNAERAGAVAKSFRARADGVSPEPVNMKKKGMK